jgi:PPM family protein phosphatase
MGSDREVTAPLDVDALRAGWAAKGEERPRLHARLAIGARTDMGRVRENNEDKFDFLEPDEPAVLATKGRFYAVADGMGGHQAGQIASELALKTVFRAYYADRTPDVGESLQRAVEEANRYLTDVARMIPERSGMGTTLTGAVVREDELFVVQVGDSRCYLLRDGRMEQVTEDHSWVQEQVRRGTMTLEEAETSPFRNVITRSLGAAPEVEPELFIIKLEAGDRILLCSDGLTGMVDDGELFELARAGSASVATWNLVDRAVENGGKDNVTVLVLDVGAIVPWEDAREGGGDGETGRRGEGARERQGEGETREVKDGTGGDRAFSVSPRLPVSPSPHLPVSPSPRRGVVAIMKGLLGR